MKLRKIPFVEVEYIDKGTFCGGEEDSYYLEYDEHREFKHKDFVVIRKEDFEYLKEQIKQKYDRRNIEN